MSYSAQSYEEFIVPGLFAPWSSCLLEIAAIQPGERVLDVACGTGVVTRRIAPLVGSGGRVVGLDLDPGMLRVARRVASQERLAIEWQESPAEALPYPDHSFDLVSCQFGLMFFANRRLALAEMNRVLRAGGRLVLSVYQGLDKHPFFQTLHDASIRHLGKSSVQTVFSLGSIHELRQLLIDAGFQHVGIQPRSITARFSNPDEFLAWEIGVDPADTPAMQNLDAGAQQALLAAVRQEMQAPLEEITRDGEAVFTSHAFIACAVK